MIVGQQSFSHGHWQIRNARVFHQLADIRIGLGIGGALAQQNQRPLGPLE